MRSKNCLLFRWSQYLSIILQVLTDKVYKDQKEYIRTSCVKLYETVEWFYCQKQQEMVKFAAFVETEIQDGTAWGKLDRNLRLCDTFIKFIEQNQRVSYVKNPLLDILCTIDV